MTLPKPNLKTLALMCQDNKLIFPLSFQMKPPTTSDPASPSQLRVPKNLPGSQRHLIQLQMLKIRESPKKCRLF